MSKAPKEKMGLKNKNGFSVILQRDYFWAYLMIAPNLIGLFIFYIWPVIRSFYLSFTKWSAFSNYKWAGSVNYIRILNDPDLWMAFRNTFIYAILVVLFGIIISLVVAALLNQKIRGVSIYRTLYFIPVVTMSAAVAMVWRWLYNGDFGLLNYILSLFSIQGPRWLTDANLALYSVILVGIWQSVGYNMVIFLSGLQSIPGTYYEAASIDGAGSILKFFHITLPLLTPSIFFVTVISLIGSFQVFDLIYMMIGEDSPVIEQTQSVIFLFFKNAFVLNDKGYAAAISMLLLVVILAITMIQIKLQKKWVHY